MILFLNRQKIPEIISRNVTRKVFAGGESSGHNSEVQNFDSFKIMAHKVIWAKYIFIKIEYIICTYHLPNINGIFLLHVNNSFLNTLFSWAHLELPQSTMLTTEGRIRHE